VHKFIAAIFTVFDDMPMHTRQGWRRNLTKEIALIDMTLLLLASNQFPVWSIFLPLNDGVINNLLFLRGRRRIKIIRNLTDSSE
jgi:hypothetical protein